MTANMAPVFPEFYAKATAFDGSPADAVAAIAERGAIWYDNHMERALVMDGITARRLAPEGEDREAIRELRRSGKIWRDGLLEPGVDIYAAVR